MADNERVEGEEVGLSSWPMSRSYPATSTHVQMEARKILRTMMARKKETEVVLNPEQSDSSKQERCPKEGLVLSVASLQRKPRQCQKQM